MTLGGDGKTGRPEELFGGVLGGVPVGRRRRSEGSNLDGLREIGRGPDEKKVISRKTSPL